MNDFRVRAQYQHLHSVLFCIGKNVNILANSASVASEATLFTWIDDINRFSMPHALIVFWSSQCFMMFRFETSYRNAICVICKIIWNKTCYIFVKLGVVYSG